MCRVGTRNNKKPATLLLNETNFRIGETRSWTLWLPTRQRFHVRMRIVNFSQEYQHWIRELHPLHHDIEKFLFQELVENFRFSTSHHILLLRDTQLYTHPRFWVHVVPRQRQLSYLCVMLQLTIQPHAICQKCENMMLQWCSGNEMKNSRLKSTENHRWKHNISNQKTSCVCALLVSLPQFTFYIRVEWKLHNSYRSYIHSFIHVRDDEMRLNFELQRRMLFNPLLLSTHVEK